MTDAELLNCELEYELYLLWTQELWLRVSFDFLVFCLTAWADLRELQRCYSYPKLTRENQAFDVVQPIVDGEWLFSYSVIQFATK